MLSFGGRLAAAFAADGQLCLGIDPHARLLAEWGLPDSGPGTREFGLRAVEAAAGIVGIVKPQVAFFERHGSVGYAALEDVLAAARAAGLIVIADAKRGDVGSTVAAYGEAWLSPGSPLEADAMTISAYQGVGSIAEPIALAQAHGKGLFVLAATSNPEAVMAQTATIGWGEFAGETVAAGIVGEVDAINSAARNLGSIGVVLGATLDLSRYAITPEHLTRTPVLAPGFGEQGARIGDIRSIYGATTGNVVVNVARAALGAGPGGLRDELRRLSAELAGAVGR